MTSNQQSVLPPEFLDAARKNILDAVIDPPVARTDALILEEAYRGLVEQLEAVEREADLLTERLEKRLDEDSVYRVYDEQVEENQKLREALRIADREASVAHDAIWADSVAPAGILHDNDTHNSAQSAIWRLHEAVRPLLDEASSPATTPDDETLRAGFQKVWNERVAEASDPATEASERAITGTLSNQQSRERSGTPDQRGRSEASDPATMSERTEADAPPEGRGGRAIRGSSGASAVANPFDSEQATPVPSPASEPQP